MWDRYLAAVLWAVGMLTGLNTDIVPKNQTERAFVRHWGLDLRSL